MSLETIDSETIEKALEPYVIYVEATTGFKGSKRLAPYLRGYRAGLVDVISQWRMFAFSKLPRTEPQWVRNDFLTIADDLLKRWKTHDAKFQGYLDAFDTVTRNVLTTCGFDPNNPEIKPNSLERTA